jgi:hypothetical protein
MVADEFMRQADAFIDLVELESSIGRDRLESSRRSQPPERSYEQDDVRQARRITNYPRCRPTACRLRESSSVKSENAEIKPADARYGSLGFSPRCLTV